MRAIPHASFTVKQASSSLYMTLIRHGGWGGGGGWGVTGFKHPFGFVFLLLLACLSERSVMYEDTPTLCMEN